MKLNNPVSSVYSGIDGKCCCGCSGKHYYASTHREWAQKKRGYAVKDEDINDRMIEKVIKIIENAEKIEDLGSCISTTVGKRLYIAYLREQDD